MALTVTRRRFTADEFQQMGRAGILRREDRVELIDGEVVAKVTIGPRHTAVVDRLTRHFVTCTAGSIAIVRTQGAVRLNLFNQPEPDLALLRHRDDFYAAAHPGPADILLVIEVAETSIDYDRTVKADLYARLGVAEYWIVDLNDDLVTCAADPAAGRYRDVRAAGRGDLLSPRALPPCAVPVSAVLG
jgi:Uma2 family endonuclease